ncbi:MAG: YhdP family phospholipid transporter, partial [Burkholderiaceae bacterium]
MTKSRLALFWRAVKESYRYLNIASYHALGAAFKLLLAAYFIFCLLLLTLRYSILPNISQYKGDIEQVASKALGKQVSIANIQASWRGLRPYLSLNNVVIRDQNGLQALTLPNVSATVAWSSVIVADVRLQKLEINQPDMDIRRDADGNLYVAGIFIDMQKTGDGKGVDWVLSQNEIAIHDGKLRWNDGRRGAPELALTGVNLVLRNKWRHHQLALKAIPPASFAAPLDIRADFEHPRFSKRISDFKRWKGEVYVGLEKADLTVWKPFVNYPIDLQKGEGAVFAWLKFDYAKVVDFTADLTLANVTARLSKDLEPLDLVQVNGRISIREEMDAAADGTPTLGRLGHSISLTDFSFTTNDGLIFPATTLSESYTPTKNNQAEKIQIQAKSLDLRTLAKFAEHLPLPVAQRQMLVDYAPRGLVKDFSVQWQGTYPQIASYHVKGNFIGLSMKTPLPHPTAAHDDVVPVTLTQSAATGFDNLTGSIDADDHGGSVNLNSSKLKLLLPRYFSDPVMPFEQLNMRASWSFQKQDQIYVQLQQMDIVQDGLRASLWGTHLMPLKPQNGKQAGMIDLFGKINEFDVKKINRMLPLQMPEKSRKWLIGALEEGKLKDTTVRLKGDLANFPFHTAIAGAKTSADKTRGEFSISGKIENGKLNYVPGVLNDEGTSSLWPELSEINGTITFDRSRLEVRAATAKTSGVDLTKVKVIIPELWSSDIVLDIDGTAGGALQNFVKFTIDSPVANWIGHFTNDTKASGNATLGLKLQLPLARLLESKVQGTLRFDKNDITLQSGMPPLLLTSGTLEFFEKGFNLPVVKANLLGLPVTLTGGTQHDGTIRLKADGGVSAEGLRKTYTAPAVQRLVQHISGSTRFSALINIKKRQPEITIESTLLGMALDLPTPLRKTINEQLPLKFELSGLPSNEGATMQDEIKVTLGPTMTARYLRQKSTEKNASWRVVRGGIGVNMPAPQPDSGLLASVNLKSLDLDVWTHFVSSIVG